MFKIMSNGVDYTDYMLSVSSSISFSDNTIIGNVVSKQFVLSVDNSERIFNDILDQEFVIYDGDNKLGVYRVYEKPERMTNDLEITLYDNVVLTNAPYNSVMAYPSTIQEQLYEMSSLVGLPIDCSQIPQEVLNLSVNWWDNTLSIRQHLMYIAELSSCNCFANANGGLVFKKLSKDKKYDLPETDGVEEFSTIEQFTISKVKFDNGVGTTFEYGDDSGSIYYLSSDNSYIETQEQIDLIGKNIVGLSIMTMEELVSPEIIGATVGDIIKYYDDEDTYYFMLMSIDLDYYNAEYNVMSAEGKLETQAVESVTNHLDTSTKIKKVETRVDNNEGKINIISKEVEDNTSNISDLEVALEGIKAEVSNTIENVFKFESGSNNIFDNCRNSISKDSTNVEKILFNDMSLDIDKSYLKGNDICISVSVRVVNGVVRSLNNRIGAEFDVGYADGTRKTYSVYWYLGQFDLQYLLQTSTNDHEERIWATYKLEDKEVTSVSNLKLIIDLNAELAVASNPKVEFGTKPTGIDFDLEYVRDNITIIEQKYSVIEETLEKVRIATVENTEKIVSINTDIGNIKSNISNLEVDTSNLQTALDTVNGSISSINGTISGMQTTIDETVTKQSELISTVDSLSIKTSNQEEKITTITANVTSNSNAISSANKSIDSLNGSVSSINSSIGTINASIKEIKSDYTEIKSTVDTLSLKAVSQEEKITSIDSSIDGIESSMTSVITRLDSAEISLKPTNILMAVNSQISADGSLQTTKFTLDKSGVHIAGGGLDIKNNAGTKVLYANTSGNLVINNLTANNGTFKGKISGSTISASSFEYKNSNNSSIKINDYGLRLYGPSGNGFIGMKTSQGFSLGVDSPITYSASESSDDVWNAIFGQGFNMMMLVYESTRYIQIQCLDRTYGISIWPSDEILKTNIRDTSVVGIEMVKKINHKSFDWIENGRHIDCGYIAQDLAMICEDFVLPISQRDGTTLYQINETTLIPVLSKALQELIDKVETLERRLNENGISY